jgi:deoxyribodipyrimidine photolyase-related protein
MPQVGMGFAQQLTALNPPARECTWVYVAYDQLTDKVGPLAQSPPQALGIVLIESAQKANRRPYHQQKIALVLANQRHFALEQARRGVHVRYVVAPEGPLPFAQALSELHAELGPISMMEASERELRVELEPLVQAGALVVVPNRTYLSNDEDFRASAVTTKGQPGGWRMDRFYRHIRQRTGILMHEGKPVGGRFSFDADNRSPWRGEPAAPAAPSFARDAIKDEVCELVASRFASNPGRVDPSSLPATHGDAQALVDWAMRACMPHFGTYEDAMSQAARGLFHTRLSPLINLSRVVPAELLDAVLPLDIALNNKEGFVRQLLGWREFVRQVHRATDGFRRGPAPTSTEPATDNLLDAQWPLPPAFWSGAGAAWEAAPSGLNCLDVVVRQVWDDGWTHHIPRLMVLSNLATLLDVKPRELSDWFWVAFVDAYDWVVEPNVMAMGTYATGGVMTTKPYVSGSGYIHRMSDYCRDCAFHPKKNCPVTPMYWAFLGRHEDKLGSSARMGPVLGNLRRRGPERRAHDVAVYELVRDRLGRGETTVPEDFA